MRVILRWATVVVATLVCGRLLVSWAYVPLRCSIAFTDLTRRTDLASETGVEHVRLSRLRRNIEDLRALESQCGIEARLQMLAAANEEMLGLDDDALHSYDRALTADRRPEIFASQGWLLIRLGRMEEAAQKYALASRFSHPDSPVIPSEIVERRVAEILRAQK